MAGNQRGLGRGLDALFKNTVEPSAASDITSLPVRSLAPNPAQPRKHFDESALQELADSIRAKGVLQPLLVRPVRGTEPQQYEIIAGERRWRASRLAGLREVPVLVRDLSDQETLAVALIENLQREDLNPVEEALAMHDLREQFSLSQEELARQLGKSRPAVANTLRLLQLPQKSLDDVRSGRLTPGHARALLGVTDQTAQETLRSAIIEQSLTVRDAEAAATYWKEHGTLPDTLAHVPHRAQTPRNKAMRTKTPEVKLLQKRIADTLSLKASVSGTEQKGRVTIAFDSPDDLARLLARLGLSNH